MIKLLLVAVLGLATSSARPQTILDLTEQLALDAEKLSSLKATLQEMYVGYQDLEKGYTRIRDIVKGNFDLHQAYLDALWILSPAAQSDPRLATIINTEYRIVAAYQAAMGHLGVQPVWTGQELGYITGTLAAVLHRSQQAIAELTMISTDNALRMSDAERLQALDRIDQETRQELTFIERFDAEVSIEDARRARESNDINTLKSLYGLRN